jgi:hypothetical protein
MGRSSLRCWVPRLRQGRTFLPEFRGKVASAALTGDKTAAELVQQLKLHPKQIIRFRQNEVENMVVLFAKKEHPSPRAHLSDSGNSSHNIGQSDCQQNTSVEQGVESFAVWFREYSNLDF